MTPQTGHFPLRKASSSPSQSQSPSQPAAESAFEAAACADPKGYAPEKQPADKTDSRFMPLNLYYPCLKKVHNAPPVYICENFLTDDHSPALAAVLRAYFASARVVIS